MELPDPKDVKNFFFRIPHKDFLWWRSEEDYICEVVEYLKYRHGLVFPEHAIVFSRVSIYTLVTECRIIFTTGDVDIFTKSYGQINPGLEMDDIEVRNLEDIKERHKNYWGAE